VVTPAHLLFLPIDNFKIINFLNFSDVGASPLNESAAFKRARSFSKISSINLNSIPYNLDSKYKKFSIYFKNDNAYIDSLNFGIKRQHNFLNSSAINNNYSTFFNLNSIEK